jgi:hypothetical protein
LQEFIEFLRLELKKKQKKMEGVDILPHERSKKQFDVDAMKIVWAGSRQAFEVSDRMASLVASDPVFFFPFFYGIGGLIASLD